MIKTVLNVVAVAAACLAAQSLMAPINWTAVITGVMMCIAANQVGLHQSAPFGQK